MPNSTDTKLNELVINETTEELLQTQEIQPNQLYVTPDEDGPEITKTSDLTNDGEDGSSKYATEAYVRNNGGKINSISVNGEPQTIDEKKNVDIKIDLQEVPPATKGKLGTIRLWEDEESYLNISTVKAEVFDNIVLVKKTETNTYRVDGCEDNKVTEITIPDSYNGILVDEISPYAFYNINTAKTITIGRNIKKMGKGAFYGCTGCETLNFNPIDMESVVDEDMALRYYLVSLFLSLGAGFDSSDEEEVKKYMQIMSESTSIGEDNLWFFDLGKDVKDGVTINIGDEVTQIPSTLFSPIFSSLSYLHRPIWPFDEDADYPSSVGQNMTMLMYTDPEAMASVVGGNYGSIGNFMERFKHVIRIKKLNWDKACKKINVGAFAFCNIPTDITIPDSIESIGSYAFLASSTYVVYGYLNSLASIMSGSLTLETHLNYIEELHIPSSVKNLGYRVFDGAPIIQLYIDNPELLKISVPNSEEEQLNLINEFIPKLFNITFEKYPYITESMLVSYLYLKMFLEQYTFIDLNKNLTSINIPSSAVLDDVVFDNDSGSTNMLASFYHCDATANEIVIPYFLKKETDEYKTYCALSKIQITNEAPEYIKITDLDGNEISEMYPTDQLKIEYIKELEPDYSIYEINSNNGLGFGHTLIPKDIGPDDLPKESEINVDLIEKAPNTYMVCYADDIKFDLCYQDVYYELAGRQPDYYVTSKLFSERDSIKILDTFKGINVSEVRESLFIPTKIYERIEFGMNHSLYSESSGYDAFNWNWKVKEIVLKNHSQYSHFVDNINEVMNKVYVLKTVDDERSGASGKERNTYLDENFTRTTTTLDGLDYYLYTRN